MVLSGGQVRTGTAGVHGPAKPLYVPYLSVMVAEF